MSRVKNAILAALMLASCEAVSCEAVYGDGTVEVNTEKGTYIVVDR